MKVKTSELTGSALDWAVAKADENLYPSGEVRLIDGGVITIAAGDYEEVDYWQRYSPSTDWSLAGPIIEQESMTVGKQVHRDEWSAESFYGEGISVAHIGFGPTPLIAAMRCYVISKLGNEIDIPEVLI